MARSDGHGRTPYTGLGVAGLTGHVFFELGAGVGMPLASVVGAAPAAGLWATAGAAGIRRAAGWSTAEPAGRWAGLVNGLGIGAFVAHLSSWPKAESAARHRRFVLPWLADCEDLGPRLTPAYNVILYGSAVASVAGLLRESRGGRPAGLALAALAVPVLGAAQHWEIARLRAQARRSPAWWNRRLRT
ncbi:hypothetical protein Kfla_5251 [Kribbella flavida DSM 17836]|uniref:Uncharacterized protein n=1 Tax=Kribbella flavida (strain DSM 17836 / JCM 10339 / NBRC 14399) TaxID=479435 RepID=D2PL10_KRIFD|nr:hypothetical protein [Kribbella flavida]ADB34265.1 hypothetical protein Kfla_5251 [Kribbella flavida DSM 17836]